MSSNLLYFYANGSATLTTNLPSSPSFYFQFTKYELKTQTDLIVNNISSATLIERVALVRLVFGSDFDLTTVSCAPLGYTCTVNGSQIDLTVSTPGTLPSITIQHIVSPSLSPSTKISLLTFTINNYLIDSSQTIIWTAACQLPCRTCSTTNTSACLSCYSD